MGKFRSRPFPPSAGGARSDRDVVAAGPTWSYLILVAALALLTSPLWLLQPSRSLGSIDQSRAAGAAFWLAVGVVAAVAGQSWGHRLTLNEDRRTVAREVRGPWRTKVLWSYAGRNIEAVSLIVDPEGVGWLQAAPLSGKPFLIESGTNVDTLRELGEVIARCWEVPFRVQ